MRPMKLILFVLIVFTIGEINGSENAKDPDTNYKSIAFYSTIPFGFDHLEDLVNAKLTHKYFTNIDTPYCSKCRLVGAQFRYVEDTLTAIQYLSLVQKIKAADLPSLVKRNKPYRGCPFNFRMVEDERLSRLVIEKSNTTEEYRIKEGCNYQYDYDSTYLQKLNEIGAALKALRKNHCCTEYSNQIR